MFLNLAMSVTEILAGLVTGGNMKQNKTKTVPFTSEYRLVKRRFCDRTFYSVSMVHFNGNGDVVCIEHSPLSMVGQNMGELKNNLTIAKNAVVRPVVTEDDIVKPEWQEDLEDEQ